MHTLSSLNLNSMNANRTVAYQKGVLEDCHDYNRCPEAYAHPCTERDKTSSSRVCIGQSHLTCIPGEYHDVHKG